MTQPDAIDRIDEHYNELVDLMRRKNAGYAGASDDPWVNFRAIEPLATAEVGLMARIGDKWNRLRSLMLSTKNDQVGESIFETIDDMINYLAIMYEIMQQRLFAQTGQLEPVAKPESWWRCRAYIEGGEACNGYPDSTIHSKNYPLYDHDFV